jgi:methylated-DNA-protein-cysteine methyltransferase related protein
MAIDGEFRSKVEDLMVQVPSGWVTTYGDLAAHAGHPYAASVVGGIAHSGNISLPWHRLVNRFGGLASGYHGGRREQAEHLMIEGTTVTEYVVDGFKEKRWKFKIQ